MKSLHIVCVLFILTFFIAKPALAGNLIANPGFEADDQSWKTNNSGVVFTFDPNDYYDATRSAKVENTKSSSYGIEQTITDISSTLTYKLEGYVKVAEPYPEKAYLRIAWYTSTDGTGSQASTDDSPFATASAEWQKLELIKTPSENIHSAKIRLLVATGTAFFDGMILEEYIAPTEAPSPTPLSTPTTLPTGMPSPTLEPVAYNNIYISEIMVNPDSLENEWVELYNDNDFEVTLTDWYIDDIENAGSSPRMFDLYFSPKTYAVYEFSTGLFNNDGDSVRLLDSTSALKDSMEYSLSTQGKTIARTSFDTDIFCDQEPSKGTANLGCTISSTPSITSISQTIHAPPRQSISPLSIGAPFESPQPLYPLKSTPKKTSVQEIAYNSGEILGEKTNSFENTDTPVLTAGYTKAFSSSSASISLLNIFYIFHRMIKRGRKIP